MTSAECMTQWNRKRIYDARVQIRGTVTAKNKEEALERVVDEAMGIGYDLVDATFEEIGEEDPE